MNYLLDTNIIIIYSKDKSRARRIEADHRIFAKENNLAISIVSIGEINSVINQKKYSKPNWKFYQPMSKTEK